MEALPACRLQDVSQEALGSAVIGIDEGQFVSVGLGAGGSLCPPGRGGKPCPGQSGPAGPRSGHQTFPLVPGGLEPVVQAGCRALVSFVPCVAVWACATGSRAKCCPFLPPTLALCLL